MTMDDQPMTDLSADRPLLLPEKQFTDEDARLLAEFFCTEESGPCNGCRMAAAQAFRHFGPRLLAPSAEHREEAWGIRSSRFGVDVVGGGSGSEELARRASRLGSGTLVRMVTTRFTDGSTLTGPWVEVEGSQPDAP